MTNTIERVSELSTFNEPELLRGSMFQYENQAHTFVIECTQDGQHVDLQGDITARFMRADRNTVYLAPAAQDPDQEAVANDLTSIDSEGRAVVTLHRDCYNVGGRFQLTVYNVSGGRTVCIYACVGAIRLTQSGALIDSGEAFDPASFSDDIATLGTLIQQTNAAKDAANAAAASVAGDIADLKSALEQTINLTPEAVSAYRCNINSSGKIVSVDTTNDWMVYAARVIKGKAYTITTSESQLICAFFNTATMPQRNDTAYDDSRTVQDSKTITAPIDGWIAFRSSFTESVEKLTYVTAYDALARTDIKEIDTHIEGIDAAQENVVILPAIANGSGGNPSNSYLVTAKVIPLINNACLVSVKNTKPVESEGNYYLYTIGAYKGTTWYTDRSVEKRADANEEIIIDPSAIIQQASDVTGFGVTIAELDSSGDYVTLRRGDFDSYPVVVRYIYGDQVQTNREIENEEITHKLLNARHQKSGTGTPLTLLHISDIHGDEAALKRIMVDAGVYGSLIDGKICTGDMRSNVAGEIASWWDASIMTCIGNHDTASYSGGTYDWTDLSMEDRDTYYIAPFENGWDITHTEGTSYYYKDYATQKVRLIVMDGMLYTGDTTATEAAAQTAWLEGLLGDTLDSEDTAYGYHVLIAIHAPHGGATAEDCSFSRYGQTTMPTYSDCNTPQSVIDAVSTKITAGVKFIGYLVGHTHQDNIFDAENDGKQLMYCVTCGSTGNANWIDSDQDRSRKIDAYNIVTIDTTNTLVKIIRGGGANIDDHARTRKAICFNYSTGAKVGEVL